MNKKIEILTRYGLGIFVGGLTGWLYTNSLENLVVGMISGVISAFVTPWIINKL